MAPTPPTSSSTTTASTASTTSTTTAITRAHLLSTIPSILAPAPVVTTWLQKVLQYRGIAEPQAQGDGSDSSDYQHDFFLLGEDIWRLPQTELYQALPPVLPDRVARLVASDVVSMRQESSARVFSYLIAIMCLWVVFVAMPLYDGPLGDVLRFVETVLDEMKRQY